MSHTAYPLQWPGDWPRTKSPERARFGCTFAQARDGIIRQLGLMGIDDWNIVISSNVALRRDGLPYANQAEPSDVGVAVYWMTRKREQQVIACDRWDRTRDNLRAVEKTIGAMRGIDRWGSSDVVSRAFQGFAALPAPVHGAWRDVFGYGPLTKPTISELQTRYHDLAHERHPDRGGGSTADMVELNRAYEKAKKELRV